MAVLPASSETSIPAQKFFPAPLRRITRTSGSASSVLSAWSRFNSQRSIESIELLRAVEGYVNLQNLHRSQPLQLKPHMTWFAPLSLWFSAPGSPGFAVLIHQSGICAENMLVHIGRQVMPAPSMRSLSAILRSRIQGVQTRSFASFAYEVCTRLFSGGSPAAWT